MDKVQKQKKGVKFIDCIETGAEVSAAYMVSAIAVEAIKNRGATKILPSNLIHTPAILLGPIAGAAIYLREKC